MILPGFAGSPWDEEVHTTMGTRSTWLAIWALVFGVAAGGGAAAEETALQFSLAAPAAPAEPGAAGADFTLTIKETILLALKNNLDITIEGFNPRIREMDIATAKAAFDPVFTGSVSDGRSRTHSNTAAFIPGALLSSDLRTFTYNLQLNDKLPTGASAQLAWTNQRQRTNSFSVNFNPGYTTGLTLTLTQPLLKNFGIDVNETPIKLAMNNRQIFLPCAVVLPNSLKPRSRLTILRDNHDAAGLAIQSIHEARCYGWSEVRAKSADQAGEAVRLGRMTHESGWFVHHQQLSIFVDDLE